jgi:hypothetical protein
MNRHTLPRGGTLVVAVFAALAPLAAAGAGTNPEVAPFYTLDRDLGSAPATASQGAKGPMRTDDPSGAGQAANPELGSFYRAHDLDGARGAKGPIRTDPSGTVARAGNPELGSFYRTQDVGGAPAARLGGTQDAMRTGDSSN